MKLIKKIKLIIYDSRKLQTQKNTRRLHWKHIADEFNSSKNVLEMKSGHICKERWKNCLQRKSEKYSKLQLIIYHNIFFKGSLDPTGRFTHPPICIGKWV